MWCGHAPGWHCLGPAEEAEGRCSLGERYAWREQRRRQSSRRICVEHANAEHKKWRRLQRFLGRREHYPATHRAIAAMVSDRAARRATRHFSVWLPRWTGESGSESGVTSQCLSPSCDCLSSALAMGQVELSQEEFGLLQGRGVVVMVAPLEGGDSRAAR